jgi:hypothetical protein
MSDNIRTLYELIKKGFSYEDIKDKLSETNKPLSNTSMFCKLITLVENLITDRNNRFKTEDYDLITDYISMSLKEKDFDVSVVIQRFKGLKRKWLKASKIGDSLSLKRLDEKFKNVRLEQLSQDGKKLPLLEVFLNCGDIDFIKYLIKNRPDIINTRDNSNEHIFNYVVDEYLNLIIDNSVKNIKDREEYLRNLIFLFLESPRVSFDEYDIEMITSVIDKNRVMLKNKMHISGEKVYYLLDKIEEELKPQKIDFDEISDCLSFTSCKREDYDVNRRSLKNIYTVAIDTSKKVKSEDAFSLSYSEKDGCYILMFHVADISNVSTFDTLLDKNARNRGKSFFEDIDIVNNMIDRDILKENYFDVDKETPAVTFIVKIDAMGEILGQDVIKSKIVLNRKISFKDIRTITKKYQQAPSEKDKLGKLLMRANDLARIIREKTDSNGKLKYVSHDERNIVTVFSSFINYVAADICLKTNTPFIADIKGVGRFKNLYNPNYFIENRDLIKRVLISENVSIDNNTLKYPRHSLYSTRMDEPYSGISGKWTSPFRFYAGLLNFWIAQDLLLNKSNKETKEEWEKRVFYLAPKQNAILFYNNNLIKKDDYSGKKEEGMDKLYYKVANN